MEQLLWNLWHVRLDSLMRDLNQIALVSEYRLLLVELVYIRRGGTFVVKLLVLGTLYVLFELHAASLVNGLRYHLVALGVRYHDVLSLAVQQIDCVFLGLLKGLAVNHILVLVLVEILYYFHGRVLVMLILFDYHSELLSVFQGYLVFTDTRLVLVFTGGGWDV